MTTFLTDIVIDAVRITREVYRSNVRSLIANHPDSALTEMKRAALMDQLLADENLCEMLAGRIDQISHGS